MTPLTFTAGVLVFSIVAGTLGSLLGLGGGIIIIPVLTLLFHIDIRYAIGHHAQGWNGQEGMIPGDSLFQSVFQQLVGINIVFYAMTH